MVSYDSANTIIFLITLIVLHQQKQVQVSEAAKHNASAQHPCKGNRPPVNWTAGLREAVYRALLRFNDPDPYLRNHLHNLPIINQKIHNERLFGDIVLLAKGQIYQTQYKSYKLKQDSCGSSSACAKHYENSGISAYDEIIGLWTVERLRHHNTYGHSYEFQYKIILRNPYEYSIVKYDGKYDYSVPGHVYVVQLCTVKDYRTWTATPFSQETKTTPTKTKWNSRYTTKKSWNNDNRSKNYFGPSPPPSLSDYDRPYFQSSWNPENKPSYNISPYPTPPTKYSEKPTLHSIWNHKNNPNPNHDFKHTTQPTVENNEQPVLHSIWTHGNNPQFNLAPPNPPSPPTEFSEKPVLKSIWIHKNIDRSFTPPSSTPSTYVPFGTTKSWNSYKNTIVTTGHNGVKHVIHFPDFSPEVENDDIFGGTPPMSTTTEMTTRKMSTVSPEHFLNYGTTDKDESKSSEDEEEFNENFFGSTKPMSTKEPKTTTQLPLTDFLGSKEIIFKTTPLRINLKNVNATLPSFILPDPSTTQKRSNRNETQDISTIGTESTTKAKLSTSTMRSTTEKYATPIVNETTTFWTKAYIERVTVKSTKIFINSTSENEIDSNQPVTEMYTSTKPSTEISLQTNLVMKPDATTPMYDNDLEPISTISNRIQDDLFDDEILFGPTRSTKTMEPETTTMSTISKSKTTSTPISTTSTTTEKEIPLEFTSTPFMFETTTEQLDMFITDLMEETKETSPMSISTSTIPATSSQIINKVNSPVITSSSINLETSSMETHNQTSSVTTMPSVRKVSENPPVYSTTIESANLTNQFPDKDEKEFNKVESTTVSVSSTTKPKPTKSSLSTLYTRYDTTHYRRRRPTQSIFKSIRRKLPTKSYNIGTTQDIPTIRNTINSSTRRKSTTTIQVPFEDTTTLTKISTRRNLTVPPRVTDNLTTPSKFTTEKTIRDKDVTESHERTTRKLRPQPPKDSTLDKTTVKENTQTKDTSYSSTTEGEQVENQARGGKSTTIRQKVDDGAGDTRKTSTVRSRYRTSTKGVGTTNIEDYEVPLVNNRETIPTEKTTTTRLFTTAVPNFTRRKTGRKPINATLPSFITPPSKTFTTKRRPNLRPTRPLTIPTTTVKTTSTTLQDNFLDAGEFSGELSESKSDEDYDLFPETPPTALTTTQRTQQVTPLEPNEFLTLSPNNKIGYENIDRTTSTVKTTRPTYFDKPSRKTTTRQRKPKPMSVTTTQRTPTTIQISRYPLPPFLDNDVTSPSTLLQPPISSTEYEDLPIEIPVTKAPTKNTLHPTSNILTNTVPIAIDRSTQISSERVKTSGEFSKQICKQCIQIESFKNGSALFIAQSQNIKLHRKMKIIPRFSLTTTQNSVASQLAALPPNNCSSSMLHYSHLDDFALLQAESSTSSSTTTTTRKPFIPRQPRYKTVVPVDKQQRRVFQDLDSISNTHFYTRQAKKSNRNEQEITTFDDFLIEDRTISKRTSITPMSEQVFRNFWNRNDGSTTQKYSFSTVKNLDFRTSQSISTSVSINVGKK